MRIALIVVLAAHGLLHLLGFLKIWGLADLPQLKGSTLLDLPAPWAKGSGALWALACFVFIVAAVMVGLGRERWWLPAAVAVALSQLLIVNAWSDARAGTVANVILSVAIIVGAAQSRFHRQTDAAVSRLLAAVPAAAASPVTRADLAPLPPPVRRWLEASGVVGRERARVVRLEQRGWLRTGADQSWMPATARQVFTVDEPGFVWSVDVKMKGVLPIIGRDSYRQGRGRMLIKAAGLITVADGYGGKVDQGTLLRFLGEIVWFPSAALAPYIRWEAVGEATAKATMSHGGVTASALFTFAPDGRVLRVAAERYFGAGAEAKLKRWEVPIRAWREMGGTIIPVEGSVVWKLASGNFDYYRWEITHVESNPRPVPAAMSRAPTTVGPNANVLRAPLLDTQFLPLGGRELSEILSSSLAGGLLRDRDMRQRRQRSTFRIVGLVLVPAALAISCATTPPQPPQQRQLAQAVSPPKRAEPPQPLPGTALAVLKTRMAFHARDMGDLVSAIMILDYGRIHDRAAAISSEPSLARPLTGDATELASALPASFFLFQDELRSRAITLASAATEQSAFHVADAYGRLSETCVKCHATFRHGR